VRIRYVQSLDLLICSWIICFRQFDAPGNDCMFNFEDV
jgi:hypothetical protein